MLNEWGLNHFRNNQVLCQSGLIPSDILDTWLLPSKHSSLLTILTTATQDLLLGQAMERYISLSLQSSPGNSIGDYCLGSQQSTYLVRQAIFARA